MTVTEVRQQISTLSPEEIRRLAQELAAIDQYQKGELDISGFAIKAGLSSLAKAPSLLREYGVEPRPEDLMVLEGMLAALQGGTLDFVWGDDDLYAESDLRERYR